MELNYLWAIFFCTLFPGSISLNCKKERICQTSRVHGLRTSDCYDRNLEEFPKCLPSNIDVLELSHNRIRKVNKKDLQLYPNIAHLYLMDNMIQHLKPDTFSELNHLETLDLSLNGISKVPPTLFQLPSLKTLYLSKNMNINIAESIEEAKPINYSSLTNLDISIITEEDDTTDFPDFGELPLLAFLNISGDQFNYISTKHFAGLCNLQILANANVSAQFENVCDCWKINQWLNQRKVKFTDFDCPINENDCMNHTIDDEDLDIFQKCREKFQKIERSILLSKIGMWIGLAVGAILILAAFLGYGKYKRSRKQKRTNEAARGTDEKDQFQLLNA